MKKIKKRAFWIDRNYNIQSRIVICDSSTRYFPEYIPESIMYSFDLEELILNMNRRLYQELESYKLSIEVFEIYARKARKKFAKKSPKRPGK